MLLQEFFGQNVHCKQANIVFFLNWLQKVSLQFIITTHKPLPCFNDNTTYLLIL